MHTGGLKLYLLGFACFSKTCFGMIQVALQRTVKAEWKREFGFFSLKTTVFFVGGRDGVDIGGHPGAVVEPAGVGHQCLDRIDDIIGGELDRRRST